MQQRIFIRILVQAILCLEFTNINAQNCFDEYLSCYCKQVTLNDSNLVVHDENYVTFENRWFNNFKYNYYLPKSVFLDGFENWYFMLTSRQDESVLAMTKIIQDKEGVITSRYLFIIYDNEGKIIDTLNITAARDSYLNIENFFMSYIILNKNKIQHIQIGPFKEDDTMTVCKKVLYNIFEKRIVQVSTIFHGKVNIPNVATDIKP